MLRRWSVSRNPRYEFSYCSMSRHAVEVDDGWIRTTGTVAVLPIQFSLLCVFRPSADLTGVEFTEAVQARSAGSNKDHTTADQRRCDRDISASGDVEIGGRRVDSNLVEAVAGPVMVDAADDEIKVMEFGVIPVDSEGW